IKEVDDDSPVELVTHGPGIAAVQTGAEAAGDIEDAIERGVIIAACENTMAAQSLTHADLINGVRTVPAGIAEIVRKQREGWSYARSEEHTSELQSRFDLVCRLLLEKNKRVEVVRQ